MGGRAGGRGLNVRGPDGLAGTVERGCELMGLRAGWESEVWASVRADCKRPSKHGWHAAPSRAVWVAGEVCFRSEIFHQNNSALPSTKQSLGKAVKLG